MDTISRGNAAEAAVLAALIYSDIAVLTPFGGGTPFDLAAVMPPDGDLVRIQVKSGRLRKGCVEFNTRATDHGNGPQRYDGKADVIAVHLPEPDSVFVVPVDECGTTKGYLRLDKPRNNQQRRIRFAADYTLASWIDSLTSRRGR
jgi:hypothetical protein